MSRLLGSRLRFDLLVLVTVLASASSLPGCGSGGGGQDAGAVDTGLAGDTGTLDTGTQDAGTTDTGTQDAGTTDAGTTDAGTTDAGTTDAGTTDSGTQDSGVSPVCPATVPSALAACTQEELVCSYGQDLDPRCRAYFTCVGGAFQARPRAGYCDGPPNLSCPSTQPSPGATCAMNDVGVTCEYESASTICQCMDVLCGGACLILDPPEWICLGPPNTPGCPDVSPNYGDACAEDALECRYLGGSCRGGTSLRCTDGYFQTFQELCPS